MYKGIAVPRLAARAVALAIHTLLDKGVVRQEYREAMRRDTVPDLAEFAARVLPKSIAGEHFPIVGGSCCMLGAEIDLAKECSNHK